MKNKLDSLFFARLFVSEQKQIASMTRHKKACLREFEILVASSQQVAQRMENIMPIKTQSDLPAKEILEKENIFVMDESRATHQDIRVIEIGILNLMPLKEDTELQLLSS